MTTNTLKLVINVYRYYGTRGANVSFVCLPWRKTFRQAPKKRTLPLPSAASPLPPYSCPPLNLCADNEMQTNHVGETSAKCRAERRFMGAKWKYYHKQKTRGGEVGCRRRGSQPRTAAGQSYQHLLLLLLSRVVSCQNCMFIA